MDRVRPVIKYLPLHPGEVAAGLEDSVWLLRVRYDDGFVAYVDGQEVARRGLLGVPPAFNETAAPNHEITDPSGFDEVISLLDAPGLIAPGPHVLAAEIHKWVLRLQDRRSRRSTEEGKPGDEKGRAPYFGR